LEWGPKAVDNLNVFVRETTPCMIRSMMDAACIRLYRHTKPYLVYPFAVAQRAPDTETKARLLITRDSGLLRDCVGSYIDGIVGNRIHS
jgi:hypothetical protein